MRKLKLDELGRWSPEEYQDQSKINVVVVLDDIRSGLNVGAFFRTSDSFGLSKICLCGITPTPLNKEINKSAIGADRTVAWSYHEQTTEAIIELKEQGYYIIGVEQTTASITLQSLKIEQDLKIAIVFGNEVNGVSEDVLPLLDKCIEIAQYGTKHSLNVAVCGGIVLWEVARQIRLI